MVNESDVPYSKADDVVENGLDSKYAYDYDVAHLNNVYRINKNDNTDAVKLAIMEHGAVGAAYTHYGMGVNYINNSYYDYNGITAWYGDGGHAVMIVGWDDDYSKDNFTTSVKPTNNGAWLVRNSWGSDFSYFWMSYETYSLDKTFWAFDFSSDDGYDNNYQYDGGLETSIYPFYKTVANVFTVPEKEGVTSETLKAVSLSFMETADVGYKIEIYTDVKEKKNGNDGYVKDIHSGVKQEAATTIGRTTFAGIYTIPLEKWVELTPGSSYAVVVTTDKSAIEQEASVSYENFSTKKRIWDHVVSGVNNRSFYYNGSNFGIWPYNYCIKAFTSNETAKEEPQNQLTPKGYSLYLTEHIGAQLYASLSSDILEDTGAKVRFIYPDGSYMDKPLSDFDIDTYDNENVKVLTYEAVPAKLTEKVDISIIKSDGTQSNSYVFSPADYLDEFIAGIEDDNGYMGEKRQSLKLSLTMVHMRSFILTRIHQTWQIRI